MKKEEISKIATHYKENSSQRTNFIKKKPCQVFIQ
jgi:hypothetical protein